MAFLFFFFNSNLWQLAVAWNITQALLVALLLWTMGALVCVVTVNRHVETVLQEVESTLPLRVKLNIRWNAASVHLAQASIFGLLVFVGFFVFGLAAVPQATIATWTGTPTVLSLSARCPSPARWSRSAGSSAASPASTWPPPPPATANVAKNTSALSPSRWAGS